jgi:hypothetical protein
MKRSLIIIDLVILISILLCATVIAAPPSKTVVPYTLMETRGGAVTVSSTSGCSPENYFTAFEYPVSATSPDYMHVSLTVWALPSSVGMRLVPSYDDPTTYDNNLFFRPLNPTWGPGVPDSVEFNAAIKWKIIVLNCSGQAATIYYNYTVTYPQK